MFARLGFRNSPTHVHPELSWILPLEASEDVLLAQMRKTSRQAVKKAIEAGVTVRFSSEVSDLESFWQIYQTTVSRQHFTPFSRTFLEKEFLCFAQQGKVLLGIASVEGQDVSSAIVILDGKSAYYHHGASTQAFPKISASHALQWKIIQEIKARGFTWYNFWGVVREDQTKHPWHGLSLFKRGFGGHEEAYVHAQDFPLSWRYWPMTLLEDLRRRKRGL